MIRIQFVVIFNFIRVDRAVELKPNVLSLISTQSYRTTTEEVAVILKHGLQHLFGVVKLTTMWCVV